MTDFVMMLGDFAFQEFEVPAELSAGGKQAVSTHKYPGGLRTVDTTGPDDDLITWSGTFLDGDAEQRCQQLDGMRRAGVQLPLTWSSFGYIVVIASFTWKYRRFYQIDYSISLEVVQDQTQPLINEAGDPESQMQSDIGDALDDANGFAAGITSGLVDAVSGIRATVGTVGSIVQAPTAFLGALSAQVTGALVIGRQAMATVDDALSVAGAATKFASGTAPVDMIANVNDLVEQSAAMPIAFDAVNKLSRLSKNIAAVN